MKLKERAFHLVFEGVLLFVLLASLLAFHFANRSLETCTSDTATWKDAAEKLSKNVNDIADQRDAWKAAALKEYEAIQKTQANPQTQVDWPGVLKAVAMLLK